MKLLVKKINILVGITAVLAFILYLVLPVINYGMSSILNGSTFIFGNGGAPHDAHVGGVILFIIMVLALILQAIICLDFLSSYKVEKILKLVSAVFYFGVAILMFLSPVFASLPNPSIGSGSVIAGILLLLTTAGSVTSWLEIQTKK